MNNTYVYYYAKLPKHLQKDVYLPILKALQSHSESCAIPFIRISDLEKVMDVIVLEQPLIPFYGGYRYRTFRNMVFSIEFEYLLEKEKQDAVTAEIMEQANNIVSYARLGGDDPFTQSKRIYEYLSTQVVYDREVHDYAFNVASLLHGKAVCIGLALSVKLLFDMLGIPCICVRGEHGDKRVGHAWSLVYLNGRWFPFDVTVGVCQTVDEDISYEGFCNLPDPEKYNAWDAFPSLNFRKDGFYEI